VGCIVAHVCDIGFILLIPTTRIIVFRPLCRQDGLCSINLILRDVRVTICCNGKAIITAYSECLSVASLTQYAVRMRCITLSSVACLVVPYFFPHYPINCTIFGMMEEAGCIDTFLRTSHITLCDVPVRSIFVNKSDSG
jgi:hypothetical protein